MPIATKRGVGRLRGCRRPGSLLLDRLYPVTPYSGTLDSGTLYRGILRFVSLRTEARRVRQPFRPVAANMSLKNRLLGRDRRRIVRDMVARRRIVRDMVARRRIARDTAARPRTVRVRLPRLPIVRGAVVLRNRSGQATEVEVMPAAGHRQNVLGRLRCPSGAMGCNRAPT